MADTIVGSPVLERLGIEPLNSGACGKNWMVSSGGTSIASINPATGQELASVRLATAEDYESVVSQSLEVWERWRMLPAQCSITKGRKPMRKTLLCTVMACATDRE